MHYNYPSLIPRLLPPLQHCTRETRKSGKTYHTSDIAGGTDLYNSSGTKSSQFHPLHHSLDKFYQAPSFFSCCVEKLGGAWVRGYGYQRRIQDLFKGGGAQPACAKHVFTMLTKMLNHTPDHIWKLKELASFCEVGLNFCH